MLTDIIGSLRGDPEFSQRVTHWEVVPAHAGSYADIPPAVDGRIRQALLARGIGRIYSHQLATWDAVRAGKSVVLVSPTASGKTLAYNLPVLQALLEDPDARALYLFPTKALSQDQQSELNEVVRGGKSRSRSSPMTGTPRAPSASPRGTRAGSSSPIPTCSTPASFPTTRSGSRH